MACGLSYGALLLLCTLISSGLVVHGIRLMPQTVEGTDAELQVAEEAKGMHLIHQKRALQGDCGRYDEYLDYSLTSDHKETVATSAASFEICSCECSARSECRAFEVHLDKCVLFWRNIASTKGELHYTVSVDYYERAEVSGTEDFEGPFVGWALKSSQYAGHMGVNSASECADKCRIDNKCKSFIFNENQGLCRLCNQTSSSKADDYKEFPAWDYYERRSDSPAEGFLGPFVGTFLNASTHSFTIKGVSACRQKCMEEDSCTSFAVKVYELPGDYWCYISNKIRVEVSSIGADAVYIGLFQWNYYEIQWNYYEMPGSLQGFSLTVGHSLRIFYNIGSSGGPLVRCLDRCRTHLYCQSLSYSKDEQGSGNCILSRKSRDNLPSSFSQAYKSEAGWDYYQCDGCHT